MKILLLGYGKMGKAVEQEATARGHEIVGRIDKDNASELANFSSATVDVAIEFTHPDSFQGNLEAMMAAGIPLVSGTTGWHDRIDAVRDLVEDNGGSFLYASNFSVGVNLLFELNRKLASLMNGYPEYDVFVEEQHHKFKADAPSGTAISLGQQIIDQLDRKDEIAAEELRTRAPKDNELSMGYIRAGEIIGQHTVTYRSDIDRISLTHEAYNRRGFALGAVIGAEWIVGNTGFHVFSELFR